MRRDRGLTLIELVAVVAIIGLIAALAVVRMDWLIPKYRLRGAAREVGMVLKQAKSRAASSGHDVYAVFDLSQGEYWLLVAFPKPKEDGTLPKEDEPREYEYQEAFRSKLPEKVEFAEVILAADQRHGSGRVQARVSPYGASSHVIVNLAMEERKASTKLNGLTGVVTHEERHLEPDEILEDPGE